MTDIDRFTPPELAQYPKALEMYQVGLVHPEAQVDPTAEELCEFWAEFYDDRVAQPIPGVLGVMRKLNGERPSSLISVDLCDVVRTTCEDFVSLGDFSVADAGDTYGYGIPFGIQHDDFLVTKITQGIMIDGKVGPVESADDIHYILQEMRLRGAFILANTSTLPGCEPATLRFLKQYFEDCFDGLVLPRNHDGLGKVTKGMAKIATLAEIEALEADTRITHVQHIDDAAHHIYGAREAAQQAGIPNFADVTPEYIWNSTKPNLNLVPEPVDAFEFSLDKFNEARR